MTKDIVGDTINCSIDFLEVVLRTKLTRVMALHYVKLIYRGSFFILGIILYVFLRMKGQTVNFESPFEMFTDFSFESILLTLVWGVYLVEMVLRLFPSKSESMGCQKQFRRGYEPTGREEALNVSGWRTFAVVAAWLILNGILGALYYLDILDAGILFLISLAYGVCDMICILFYCPFHSVFFRNRCCTDCRIYNWDFAMMFTPFVFVAGHWLTATLLGLSIVILIRWEITYKLFPERFSTNTNKCLDCAHCPEKLCKYKPQLARYIKKNRERLFKKQTEHSGDGR